MKKAILSWSLIFLLIVLLFPCAYAAEGNLGTATVNEYYSCTVYSSASASGLTLESGSALPPGFSLEGNMLSGVPTQAGDYDFTVTDGSTSIHCTLSVLSATDPSQISSISVNTVPTKTEYTRGSQLDTAGLVIDVNYAGGQVQQITSGFGYSPMLLDAVGVVPIEISYSGFKCYFNVTVTDSPAEIGGIGLVSLPTKMTYKPGEEFNPSGIILRVYRLDKSHYDIDSGYTYSPSTLDLIGEQTITIGYEGKTCTFTVTVAADDTPRALYIAQHPQKTLYAVGESLDTSGLKLKQVMSSGAELEISSGFSCTPVVLTSVGSQNITVTYGSLTCVFSVNVVASTPSPSPSAAPTPLPSATPSATPLVSAAPSATPHIIEHQSHRPAAGTVLLTIIFILALLMLVALCTYVYIIRHGGFEAFEKRIKHFFSRFKK